MKNCREQTVIFQCLPYNEIVDGRLIVCCLVSFTLWFDVTDICWQLALVLVNNDALLSIFTSFALSYNGNLTYFSRYDRRF
jgi:hypothetical protein